MRNYQEPNTPPFKVWFTDTFDGTQWMEGPFDDFSKAQIAASRAAYSQMLRAVIENSKGHRL